MRLYTICVDQRPVVVMSVAAEEPVPDHFVTNPELLQLIRDTDALIKTHEAIALSEGFDLTKACDLQEIDEALDTWLGSELQVLEHNGCRLWDGDRDRLLIRDARTDEASKWHLTRQDAIQGGDKDAGDESWLIYLVPVRDPTDAILAN